MIVLVLVALLWTEVHNADLPEGAPAFRSDSIVRRSPVAGALRQDAQRPAAGPMTPRERAINGLD